MGPRGAQEWGTALARGVASRHDRALGRWPTLERFPAGAVRLRRFLRGGRAAARFPARAVRARARVVRQAGPNVGRMMFLLGYPSTRRAEMTRRPAALAHLAAISRSRRRAMPGRNAKGG